jgi:hypothetical protein
MLAAEARPSFAWWLSAPREAGRRRCSARPRGENGSLSKLAKSVRVHCMSTRRHPVRQQLSQMALRELLEELVTAEG